MKMEFSNEIIMRMDSLPSFGPFLSHEIKFTVRSNQCPCVVERLWILKKVTMDPLRQYRFGSNNVVPHTNVVLNFILRSSILSNLSFVLNEQGSASLTSYCSRALPTWTNDFQGKTMFTWVD